MKNTLNIMAITALMAGPVMAETVNGLRTVDEFDAIEGEAERSPALFEEMMVVIGHPRCLNCHPVDNSPRQGMDMQMHEPPVVRGEADFGAPGMRCNTCHGEQNFTFAAGGGSIPGHTLHEHNAEDGLVGWGWHPGEGREPAPGSQEIFGELTKAWIETGAACPAG